jgi:plasmid maintenance system antidote protein VapI
MNANELPEDIRAWLETVPTLTKNDLEDLRRAGEALDQDPAFCAELIKGRFVSEMLEAMEETGRTQAEVARAWGKTRQYLNKLLNEDKRVNFTVETLCELAHFLNRRIDLKVLREDEVAHVMRCIPTERTLRCPEAAWNSEHSVRIPVATPPVLEFGQANIRNFPETNAPYDHSSLAA